MGQATRRSKPYIPDGAVLKSTMGDYRNSWVTDYAWVSGVAGAVSVLGIAVWYNKTDALAQGLQLLGVHVFGTYHDGLIIALILTTLVMVTVECIRLWARDRRTFFTLSPDLKTRRYAYFLFECLTNYVFHLSLLAIVIWFYRYAGEYGFQVGADYYQPWFRFLDIIWDVYLIAGLPYVIVTRALQFNKKADAYDYGQFIRRCLFVPINKILGRDIIGSTFGEIDKKIILGLLVKMFFAPLMTVFFFSQFPHLVNNIGYVSDGLWAAIKFGNYSHVQFNEDLYNISISVIFSIDVALAWCGYVISSRWVDNQTISAEPTVLGWLVCLLCYPPFQRELGLYFSPPGEKEAVYLFQQQWIISVFLICMVLSYIVYMASTLWFGTRFSNLTHRGIIRKGPFSIVRHPAYASKNFAWWCIMFPAIMYSAVNNAVMPALLQCLGLLIMTWIYYWRAVTEERHLSLDPAYVEYCTHVKYRFIPKVF